MIGMNWKNLVEAAGVTAIVASLVFVGMELRQSQEIAKAEIGMAALAAQIEMNNQMAERPDVWRRGRVGEELSDDDQMVFDLMIRNQNALSFWSYTSFYRIDRGSRANQAILNHAEFLHKNPGAMKSFEAFAVNDQSYRAVNGVPLESESYSDKLREVIERYEAL